MPFGFGKKKDKEEIGQGAAPSLTKNPYAAAPPASDPYTQAKQRAYQQGPPSGSGGYGGAASGGGYGGPSQSSYGASQQDNRYGAPPPRDNRYGAPPQDNKYGAPPPKDGYGAPSGGYGANKYGAPGGYGGDRYGTSNAAPASTTSRYGAGGYGGLGGKDPYAAQEEDPNRDALFAGAKDRVPKQQSQSNYGRPPPYQEGDPDNFNNPPSNPGPAYGDKQLTAEEEEEEDVQATKQQMRFMKQEDVSSTRNALRIAQQAEETGRDTLARLGAQGEAIHNTEKNLDLAHNQNRIAEEKARELKTLNKSMFAVHVGNPFTAASRREARDQAVIDKHLEARDAREDTRRRMYESDQRMQKTFKELNAGDPGYGKPRGKNLAERAKYQFEADSEDEEMENEIDSNLDSLANVTGRLNGLAKATGAEVERQNEHLDRISQKVSLNSQSLGLWLTVLRETVWIWELLRTERSWIASSKGYVDCFCGLKDISISQGRYVSSNDSSVTPGPQQTC
jgi:hypothetical protein